MTGQGDRNFERIKNEKQQRGSAVLDISKGFRTAQGNAVRGLHIKKTNKVVVGSRVITSAHYRSVIVGQVYVQNQWLPAEWNDKGVHAQEQFNLVEIKSVSTQQSLF